LLAGRSATTHCSSTGAEGFARIGLSVRAEVLASKRPSPTIHLGTVYGGQAFASKLFPAWQRAAFPVIGDGANRLPLIHVPRMQRARGARDGSTPHN